jgi:peptidoglycan/LPS O-acetylase OafA/YrhL
MAVLPALSNHSASLARGKDNTTPPHANPLAFDSCILSALCVVGELLSRIRILPSASKSMGDVRRRDHRAPIPLQQWKYPSILIGFGLLSIAIAIFAYDNAMAWPSYWALLPVIGTCLVIAANQADASLFRNQIVQTLGKWSYSVYLWHWPIAVAAAYFYFVKTTALKNRV